VIVVDEGRLERIPADSFWADPRWWTHLSMAMGCPASRAVQPIDRGRIAGFGEAGDPNDHSERIAV
jgi:hypothetical protein